MKLEASKTDERDIFSVFKEYTSENGMRWRCIAKADGFAWLKHLERKGAEAYVWKLNGESVSQKHVGGYDIKPEPIVETVTLYGDMGLRPTIWFDADEAKDSDEYRITFDLIDGEPDCSSIVMERV